MSVCNFQRLPPEIKRAIWQLALPDDEPEVWVIQRNAAPVWRNHAFMMRNRLVYTSYPAAFHVDRASRCLVYNLGVGNTSFCSLSHPSLPPLDVPVRRVRPLLDILYWDPNGDSVSRLLESSPCACIQEAIGALTHLAVPVNAVGRAQDFILKRCPVVRTLSVVFAPSAHRSSLICDVCPSPNKRLTLRAVSREDAADTTVDGGEETPSATLQDFIHDCHVAINRRDGLWSDNNATFTINALHPRHLRWQTWLTWLEVFGDIRVRAAVLDHSVV